MEIGQRWYPREKMYPLPWRITKIFKSSDGEEVYRLEKYGRGRNSLALLSKKQLNRNFSQVKEKPRAVFLG